MPNRRTTPKISRGARSPRVVRDRGRADPAGAPAAEAGERPADLTRSAYDQLRADIVRGRLQPDQKLAIDALRERFNYGSTPIREALNRLFAEGLVALEPQKGFRVTSVTEEDFEELLAARRWIDGAAITEAIRRHDQDWEESLLIALHRLSRAVRQRPDKLAENEEWEARHRAFHKVLVSGCGSRWLVRISEQLFDAAERYRLLGADQFPADHELDEHRAIVDACLAGDTRQALDLLAKHYEGGYKLAASPPRRK
jgi:DNA-binding GntR family transcriptional regulator